MPGDVLGTNMFNFQTKPSCSRKGPIFTEMLLADEINRTPPKTQAALLEAMQERARHHRRQRPSALGDQFMVVATQNPIEQQGTYPLPEAQLDRFLFKIDDRLPEPRRGARHRARGTATASGMPRLADFGSQPVVEPATSASVRAAVTADALSDELIDYVVDVIRATREHAIARGGGSTRAPPTCWRRRRAPCGAARPRFRDP